MSTPSTSPVIPSHEASAWHVFASDIGNFISKAASWMTSPAGKTLGEGVMDAGLVATGNAEVIPVANSAFVGTGELLEAAAKFKAANPGSPLTGAGLSQYTNFAQSTLSQLEDLVGLGAPKVAAQMAKINQPLSAAASLMKAVSGASAAPAASTAHS